MNVLLKRHWFGLSLIILCLLYFFTEFFLNSHLMFSVDEFWFAHRIYQYKDGLPYRDFAPYKTVLGYYLLLLPLLMTKGIIQTLIFTKNMIALANTFILFVTAFWLTRFFSRAGVLASFILLISSEIFIFYSTNIRVDLIGYWFGFISLLLLLDRRFLLAGLFLALGFMTTQKIIWYLFASNIALITDWFFINRNKDRFFDVLKFNLVVMSCILYYIILWSQIAHWPVILNSLFIEAKTMYQLDWYDSSRKLFWSYLTFYNPLLFLLCPISLLSIIVPLKADKHYSQRLFVVVFSATILLSLVPYKQVFPYYMQAVMPVFFILYAAFFSWFFQLVQSPIESVKHKKLILLIVNLHVFFVAAIIILFKLPNAYLLIAFIPGLFGVYFTHTKTFSQEGNALLLKLMMILTLFSGLIYPASLYLTKLKKLDGAYQKTNIKAIDLLLKDGSNYVAGIELIYNKTQPIAGLRHLMGPAIDYLYQPTEKLKPVMLASLYEDPNVTQQSIIANLKESKVKFYVNNYRMTFLPPHIKNYLNEEYEHLFGSIYCYSPTIPQGQQSFKLKFKGYYLFESFYPDEIILNNKKFKPNSLYYLTEGSYFSKAKKSYRLKLIPDQLPLFWQAKFQHDEWRNMIE